ncbi:hypothetical protein [Actinomyces sp. oral taxon 414]|uniref:hypothetical protein n=1 Tax=Actinomyces sp. oral taxon 414 TaxID=712122 RepID=UPI003F8C1702
MDQAQPEAVASWARDHWAIENRLHWIRDVVTGEDRHQLRTANGPFGLGRPAQPRHQPHQTLPRPPSPHRRHHQSHGPTPRTSHRPDHPTNHLNRLCRPPGPPPRAVKSLAALAAGGSASRPAPPAATTWPKEHRAKRLDRGFGAVANPAAAHASSAPNPRTRWARPCAQPSGSTRRPRMKETKSGATSRVR